MSAVERKLQILQMIPRFPKKISSIAIMEKLEKEKIIDKENVEIRTVQRDLEDLSRLFPIMSDEEKKPYGWSWEPDAKMVDIPTMDPVLALTFTMVKGFLNALMPPMAFRNMNPYFSHASKVLDGANRENLREWPEKIKIISRSQPLCRPNINESIIETVYECLLEGKRFSATYKRKGETEPVIYTVNPIGIVVVDAIIYLVCTLWDYNSLNDVRQLSLHRISAAEKLDAPVTIPDGFNLQGYIDSGAFGYLHSDQTIKINVIFEKNAALHLQETPLSEDQVITDIDSERVMVEATVFDSEQLRWWLSGFGEKVEIIEPASLRDEFKQIAEKMCSFYSERQ
jgi:predicted DNA-binding transcriptional regulator YafY